MAPPARIWLLAGPPFSAAQYRPTLKRLGDLRPALPVEAIAVSPLGGSWSESAAALVDRIQASDVVFAHGLAVPVACAVATQRSLGGLILSNGPLRRVDPATDAVIRLAAVPGVGLLPFLRWPWLAWLRSSVGLRRAVNNPYAMDRDTVAAVCGELVSSPAGSMALRRWLGSLRTPWPDPAGLPGPLRLLWGDNDRLHPLADADEIDAVRGGGGVSIQEGGRFAWPEEMPWALADAVLFAFDQAHPSATPEHAGPVAGASDPVATTPESRKGGRRRSAARSQRDEG